MKISVAMIVKNEAEQLPWCLLDIANFADEIVILDTGSTDNTAQLAEGPPGFAAERNVSIDYRPSIKFNADTPPRLFRFNVARNEAIDLCLGDWIVIWDADDRCTEEAAAAIRAVAKKNEPGLYRFTLKYGALTYPQARMFPARKGVGYAAQYSCHETLICSSTVLPLQLAEGVFVTHAKSEKGSGNRNLLILEQDYYVRGYDNSRNLFYLASAYREHRMWQQALDMYQRYLEVSMWAEERFFARYYMAQCHAYMGHPEMSRDEAYRALTERDDFAEAYCVLGDACAKLGLRLSAMQWYQKAGTMSIPKDSVLFANPEFYGPYSARKLEALGPPKGDKGAEGPPGASGWCGGR